MYNQTSPLKKIKHFKIIGLILLFIFSGLGYSCKEIDEINNSDPADVIVKFWLTDAKQNILFKEQKSRSPIGSSNGLETIVVDDQQTYQTMDGFGYTLTGGSAYHIFNMSPSARTQLLTELFDHSNNNIGVSYLRLSIGASDLDAKVFSYNDLPQGEIDTSMQNFSLDEDRQYLIPVLKEILQIFPEIKLLGSPWSAPIWMKTNNSSIGGSLKPEYYDAYAKYFVKYIQEMKNEGIVIDAITVQNEPLHPGNNPSMFMSAQDQAAFIKNSLGPAFRDAGIQTKIIIYDHNADRIDYPLAILNDPEAKQYVDGSAFHLYGGSIDALSQVHNAHPDKNLYFTEQWVGAPGNFSEDIKWHIRELIIGASRNWCKTVLEWNLAADENQDPHTQGGCDRCLGAVTIQGDAIVRNPAYYITAHASKFVRPGSKRIESNEPADLQNVAFSTPGGNTVVIVLNNSGSEKYFNIKVGEVTILVSLTSGSVGTYIW